MKAFIFTLSIFLFVGLETLEAQPERRLYETFVPYQWEIYNTKYNRRYWDWRDNYDFIQFKEDYTFMRRYQGIEASGTWTYNRKGDLIELNITAPFEKKITLKVVKLSRKELVYSSSEEDYKVTMYLKEGEIPKRKPPARKKN